MFTRKLQHSCSVTYCKTGYERKGQVAEYHPVFGFTDTKPSLKEKWFRFVNRKHRTPTKNSSICAKRFEEKYLTSITHHPKVGFKPYAKHL